MVYFAGNREQKVIKIGKSKNPDNRIKVVQRQSYCKIELFNTIEGSEMVERSIHQMFHNKALGNEWFILDDEMWAFVQNPVVSINTWFKDHGSNTIVYEKDIDEQTEKLYSEGLTNIAIMESLNINIAKVRRVIRFRKLANKYRHYKNVLDPEYNRQRNIRKKYRKLYREKQITKDELMEVLSKYPVKQIKGVLLSPDP